MSDLYDKQHDAEIVRLNDRITELEAEVHYLTNAGTIECMVRNKAVAEYIAGLESRLADAIEAQQALGLKLAHAEGHSANTVGQTPGAAPACASERSVSESIAAGHPCFDPDGPPDHDWEYVDDSFSHEFGTEICGHYECARCNAIKPE